MPRIRIFLLLLLAMLSCVDAIAIHRLKLGHAWQQSQLESEEGVSAMRAMRLSVEDYDTLSQWEDSSFAQSELLLAGLFCQTPDRQALSDWCSRVKEQEPEAYANACDTIAHCFGDAVCFPIPESVKESRPSVSFEDSWQLERTYGGKRGHEGCDLMAGLQRRGYYPVVSVSDGVVEKMGWLPLGGYRLGIRSPHGVYYYYAHLSDYEEGIYEGMRVSAGQLIAFMGDTGYSEVEGTTGNFPVHLHFGMYVDDADGKEVSYNPYLLLKLLERHRLTAFY